MAVIIHLQTCVRSKVVETQVLATFCVVDRELMENSDMQRIVLALVASVIWAAAASPSPASAKAQDHVKARHANARNAKRIQAHGNKAPGRGKEGQRVIESKKSKATKLRDEQKPKRITNRTHRVVEKANNHSLVQAEPNQAEMRATVEAQLDSPDTANALVALAMRYDGKNPTGWSHNWCAHYLDMVLREAGYPSGGNLAREYASYGQPTPARVGAIAVMSNHVGVVAFVGDDYVILVSGNHGGGSGHRTVGLGRYAMTRITTFRMPLSSEVIMADESKLVPAEG
jgi:hypothetical protein